MQAARVSPEEGVKGGKEGVEEVDGSFIVTSPVKSAATTAELEAIEEGDGYDVEYEDSEAGALFDPQRFFLTNTLLHVVGL